jgi:predicted nucleic acid-binding protein
MSADKFLDTNVFVYAFDKTDAVKQERAFALIQQPAWTISWQVIQEFAHVALHRFKTPFKTRDLAEYVDLVLWPRCTVFPSADIYRHAFEIHEKAQYRFYDSVIVASALAAGATTLYSEDLQHGRSFGPLKILNPFQI